MKGWTPEQWATLLTAAIGAVAAAVVSIIDAWKGHRDRRDIRARLGAVERRLPPAQHEPGEP
jgi:hypothetical protein